MSPLVTSPTPLYMACPWYVVEWTGSVACVSLTSSATYSFFHHTRTRCVCVCAFLCVYVCM